MHTGEVSSRDPGSSLFTAEDEARLGKARLVCALTAGLLALGVWANFPYLMVEHQRLPLWKALGLWIGDLAALVWFLRFVFVHVLLGEPLRPVRLSNGRARLKWLAYIVAAALLADLLFTFFLMYDERKAYAHGQFAEARIVAFQIHKRPDATWYEMDCRFADRTGAMHDTHLRVQAKGHMLPSSLPWETQRAILVAADRQNPIRVRYDPKFPARAWLVGLGWQDENGIYWVSIGCILVQAALALLFLLLLFQDSMLGEWPWWWGFFNVLPLAAETGCMLMMGLIDRFMDSIA